VDWEHVKQRRQQISDELVYVRMHPDVKVLESYVPLSAARGGNPNFRRDDLLYELTWEDKQLAMRSRLDALDRELHDAHATNKEYMEVKALHGYATMMWTNNVSAGVRTWPFKVSRGDGVFTRLRRRDAPSPRRRRRGRMRVVHFRDGVVHNAGAPRSRKRT